MEKDFRLLLIAEQTASSVGEITSIVESIQNGFFVVTESLQEGYKEVEVGTEEIETTGNTIRLKILVKV
ncbi:methyl-accepting chemotaxis domain-containing protein [Pallidibacillus pasinlerensis]|uniref:Uncharacterized protein n=1 Tax=Pallidibacillus pasinlerensis TaxID=2703818 RepID=A0ABX0A563_9BACI|nr:hypothetical protein [Pallidibacillus pasinlerensis]NCU18598.1 hypothetical protein [Pallidibacillus pasinlerensis]